MDYYSSSRGRSSFRGTRGSRGASRSRGYATRGSRGSYSQSKYPSAYDGGSKYTSSSSSSQPYSSSHRSQDDYYSRRSESFGTREREHRSELNDLASRKRERSDSYSQGVSRRSHEDEYRSSGSSSRYGTVASRSYEEPRVFKKPRSEFKPEYKSDHRVKEPLRARPSLVRGRGISARGSFASRRPRATTFRLRSSAYTRSTTGPASASEILAIRRAKLLQKRLNEEQAAAGSDAPPKTDATEEGAVKQEDQPSENEESGNKEVTLSGKHYIKLECPTCSIKCTTFREYTLHLTQTVHVAAAQQSTEQLKAKLSGMRLKQRQEQKQIEADDLESLETTSNFCTICKLNYSQEVAVHEASDMHKQLKVLLLPSCKVCRLDFSNPIGYEKHMCSLHHIRQKNAVEERQKRSLPASGILDRFMVLDSVGSGDDGDEKDEEKSKDKDTEAADAAAAAEAENLNLGAEFIHDVTAKFCEVCRVYLRRPREGDYSVVIKRHCRTKEHLRCYLHYGNDELLEKMNSSDAVKDQLTEPKGENEEVIDESKLWDAILDDSEGRHKSDDEDEEEGGRFDRINSKEKHGNGEVLASSEEGDGIDEVAATEAEAQVTQAPVLTA